MRGPFLAFVCLLGTVLAACDQAPEYAAIDSPKENRIRLVRHEHVVRFPGNAAALDAHEAARLAQFLGSRASDGGATIAVGPGTSGALVSSRERAVRDALAARGYRAVDVFHVSSADALNQVIVSVASAVVVTPRCPDYSKPTEYNYTNTPHSNFGCASAHNLGVMVADPADLARGRDEGTLDGTQSVLGVQRYRTGKVTPLKDPGDSSSSGNGSSSGSK
jgi:pilus assembly protein CpaD